MNEGTGAQKETDDDSHYAAGHAEHFLGRLDRLDDERVELALTMYRDKDSVMAVLALLELPEDSRRVAFALDAGEAPPHVLVTRDGHFVTCLAGGMSTVNCHEVTYQRFVEAVLRVEHLRDRMHRWRERKDQTPFGPIGRLVRSGPWVPREDIEAALAMVPLTQGEYLARWVNTPAEIGRDARWLAAHTKPAHRASVDDKKLLGFWHRVHSLGHLAVTSTADLSEKAHENLVQAFSPEHYDSFTPFLAALRMGRPFVSLQVLAAVARIGRSLVPLLVHQLAHATSQHSVLEASLQLAAIGVRDGSLAETARREILSDGTASDPSHEDRASTREWREKIVAYALDGDRACRETLLEPGHAELVRTYDHWVKKGWLEDPPPYKRIEDHAARDLCALGMLELRAAETNLSEVYQLARAIPWAARCDVLDFYLPAAELKFERREWAPRESWAIVDAMHTLIPRAHAPVRVEKKPGRNDACPCGSGKKYKKCCG